MNKEMIDTLDTLKVINIQLGTIAIINSFIDDGKTYSVELLEKKDNDIPATLNDYFKVSKWTYTLNVVEEDWRTWLKNKLLIYFGQYILQAKMPHILKEYEGKKNEEYDEISKRIILESDTCCEYLLDSFQDSIQKLVGDNFTFYYLIVNWLVPGNIESWYECSDDFLFDLGDRMLLLHFGTSD